MVTAHITILFLISSLFLISDAHPLFDKREKLAELRVYVHEIFGGPNQTVYDVARANITSTSPTSFGLVLVADDLMTAGPDTNSQKLGRAHILAALTGMEEMSATVSCEFVFTAGEYNGSSITTMGWKRVMGKNQEVSIIGGTGIFRMARGYTVSNLYPKDPDSYYLFSFDIYVYYLE